ncbi:MAG TPA: hypothetical protein VNE39_20920 [Planctomycetota bacterium]|nr:hypothetical protein [Planctomycetota bacterium]
MLSTTLDDARLRQIVKEAVVELLQERRGLMHDLVAQAIEDVALSRAIEEGEKTERVSREAVFKALEGES